MANGADYYTNGYGFLQLAWWTDGDGTGRLSVDAASASGFAGRSKAWFDGTTVRAFAARLADYPLNTEGPIGLEGGSQPLGGELLVQVGLRVYLVGSRGQVGIGVDLATEPWQSPAMRPEEHQSVTLQVLTTYERLRHFSRDLGTLIDGRIELARIEGEHLR